MIFLKEIEKRVLSDVARGQKGKETTKRARERSEEGGRGREKGERKIFEFHRRPSDQAE